MLTHLPLSVGVDRSLGPTVEDVRGADVAALLVVVLGVAVTAGKKEFRELSSQLSVTSGTI